MDSHQGQWLANFFEVVGDFPLEQQVAILEPAILPAASSTEITLTRWRSDGMKMEGYWFKSSKFEIEPGEDEEINPGMYGRGWLRH